MAVTLQQQKFQASTSGPHVLITGGVHGDEFEPIAALHTLAATLTTGTTAAAGTIPGKPSNSSGHGSVAVPLKRGSLTLVPCVNEDAFLRGARCASDGLDLARTCPGCPDGTVTERVADALSRLIRTADYYIDLHTGGTEYSILPFAGYMLHSKHEVLQQQRRMARAFGLPILWGTSPDLPGRSVSVARDADVPAIYCEHGGAASCSPIGTQAYVDGCLNVLSLFGMIDRPLATLPEPVTIEDPRPQSGLLQVCNPSPVDGFFVPSTALGDKIERGAPIGSVIGLRDNRVHLMKSPHAGTVLMLRTFPRVRVGESVGVVLAK